MTAIKVLVILVVWGAASYYAQVWLDVGVLMIGKFPEFPSVRWFGGVIWGMVMLPCSLAFISLIPYAALGITRLFPKK